MKHHVMVPLDGSTFAESALPFALRLTRDPGSTLELVMVQELGPMLSSDAWEAAYPEAAHAYLDELIAKADGDGPRRVSTELRVGRPASELEERARESEPDLVVMATHGRGPLSRVWLGSVADQFVRNATRPVLLVRPDGGRDGREEERAVVSHVLVPLDGSTRGEAALETATQVGREFDARYTLLRIVRYPDELVSAYVPGTVQMSQLVVDEGLRTSRAYLKEIAERLRTDGLDVDTRVVVDSRPATAILDFAEEEKVDLIAMATHGRGGVSRALMGSVTDKVVRGAHTPVLVVRPDLNEESE